MEKSRRNFIGKIGLAGMAIASMSEISTASKGSFSAKKLNKEKGLTILFQGDSITDGGRTRNSDWNHVLGHGYAYLIASRLWYDHPNKELMFYNRGISGNKVRDLVARWQQDTLDLKPDLVSILVGVNDVGDILRNRNPESIEKFEETYRKLLDKTLEASPEIVLVLCEPFLLPVGMVKDRQEIWEAEIALRQKIVRKLAAEYQTVFVEFQEVFNKACHKAPANYWI
jgi:lysophospholipase L1-like esterase